MFVTDKPNLLVFAVSPFCAKEKKSQFFERFDPLNPSKTDAIITL